MNALELLARGGYAARGVVYVIVGYFAIRAALAGGDTKSPEDAAGVLAGQPFGKVLVALLVLGLVGYAAWRAVQGITDTDGHGGGAKGWIIRAALLASGLVYLGLAMSAAAVAFGTGGGSGSGGTERDLMAQAIAFLGATWTAALICAVFLAVAAAHVVRAVRASFLRFFRVDAAKRRWIAPVGKIGLLARGAVFLVLAGLMGYRAMTASQSSEPPPNLEEVIAAVAAMPAGTWLLAALGVGLVAFAVYSFTAALYRTVDFRPLASAARNGRAAVADLAGGLGRKPTATRS